MNGIARGAEPRRSLGRWSQRVAGSAVWRAGRGSRESDVGSISTRIAVSLRFDGRLYHRLIDVESVRHARRPSATACFRKRVGNVQRI